MNEALQVAHDELQDKIEKFVTAQEERSAVLRRGERPANEMMQAIHVLNADVMESLKNVVNITREQVRS